jgi:hypothetical protein
MSLYQSLYFMSLAGGMAGLAAWAVSVIAAFMLAPVAPAARWPDLIATTVLGASVGAMSVGFGDHWSGNRTQLRFVLAGFAVGSFAGFAASLLQIPIERNLAAQSPALTRELAWLLAGSFIGLGLGLRWLSVNRARPIHAFAGGLVGGGVGGALFTGLGGQAPDLSQAAGFVLTGAGICFGITLAPILLRDGLIQFVSSGDARAHSKYGQYRKEWGIQDGDSYVIGSQNQSMDATRYRPEIEIYVPDAAIAPRHALLFAKDGRFFLGRHQDISNTAGQARYLLRVRGRAVLTTAELRDGDDIMVGRTAMRFLARKGHREGTAA